MDALRAITHALPWDDASETKLHAVQDGRPDAAASGAADHDAGVHADSAKVARQIRPKEGRRILLHYDRIPFARCDALIDLDQWIILGPRSQARDLLREDAAISGMLEIHLKSWLS